MKTMLLKYWDRIRSSFWFVPSAMALAAIAVAFGTVAVDELMVEKVLQMPRWIYTGGADGASLLLSTIAGSMITIAGVVFSMTLVALSLASSQLGPRLLRNFMRDATNQMVIGTFVSTFVYCLLVLRIIRSVRLYAEMRNARARGTRARHSGQGLHRAVARRRPRDRRQRRGGFRQVPPMLNILQSIGCSNRNN